MKVFPFVFMWALYLLQLLLPLNWHKKPTHVLQMIIIMRLIPNPNDWWIGWAAGDHPNPLVG
jgi:hypothetical protein